MKCPFALTGLSSLALFFAVDMASGEQIYPSTSQNEKLLSCRLGETAMSCTNFEGYIVVRRGGEADIRRPAGSSHAQPEAGLSANRLYLHVDAEKTP